MNAPFPKALFTHEALTAPERTALAALDEEELPKSAYIGLLATVEAVIQSRVPGFHCQYTPARSTAKAEAYALCSSLLHPENGFTPDVLNDSGKVLVQNEIGKGREWLKYPHPPIDKMLAFFFRLRDRKRAHQKSHIVHRFGLTPT